MPTWREMLADRRATRGKLPEWERKAEQYASDITCLHRKALEEHRMHLAGLGDRIPTVRPARGRRGR